MGEPIECPSCHKEILVPVPTLEKNFYNCPYCGCLFYLHEESVTVPEAAGAK